MANLKLRDARKSYGALEVIKGINLDVDDREFVVFVGPSGCGKSTLLRMIARPGEITDGDLMIDGTRANDIDPSQRGLAMVFQSYALYPHMTVAENMGFALRIAGVSLSERDHKVKEAAQVLELSHLLDRRPKDLSGGQRQRVGHRPGDSAEIRKSFCLMSRSQSRCGAARQHAAGTHAPARKIGCDDDLRHP